MKILIVNTYDRGGAANACLRLHEGLLEQGIDSKVMLRERRKSLLKSYRFKPKPITRTKWQIISSKFFTALRLLGVLKKKPENHEQVFIENRDKGLEWFSFPNSKYDITQSQLYKDADIINLHWVADFLDYKSFFAQNTKPVVWTLHDMNPFTGGEHYEEYSLYMDDNGCPVPRSITDDEIEISRINKLTKLRAIETAVNLTVVSPSRWLKEQASNSEVFNNKDIYHIPYGINTKVFKPKDRNLSRAKFNIPKDKKVILFVADSVNNKRKGFEYLLKAVEKLDRTDVILCSIGNKTSELNYLPSHVGLGVIQDEELMSMAYSAADVFVISSLMDNLPNTVLESLLCGTPVVGFPVGGIPDMIKHKKNGLLTKEISVNSLTGTLNYFLDSIDNFDRHSIRLNAVKKYDLKIQALAYIELFENVLLPPNR